MTTKKKTMYEILEVSPTALLPEIKAAHKRLSLALMSGTLGLSREEIEFKLNVLDVALHTLSVPVSRDAYDAQLAPAIAPGNAIMQSKASIVSLGDDAKVLRLVAAIEDNHKTAAAVMASHQFPMQVVSSTVNIAGRSLKKIIRAVIGLMVLGFVLTMGKMAFSSRLDGRPSADVAKAEEKIIIQEYYEKYGVRPASRAEAELLETENRRRENEQRAAAFAEKKKNEEYRRFVEESQRMGERVSDNLVHDEQRARYEEMQAMQRERELAEEKRFQEEAAQEDERIRVENARRKLGLN